MPISLTQLDPSDDLDMQALNRIMKDLPSLHPVRSAVQRWTDRVGNQQMYVAWFNARMVAFALLEGQKIRALTVHPATRRRGVAGRVVGLLLEQYPDLTVANDTVCEPIMRLVDEHRLSRPNVRL